MPKRERDVSEYLAMCLRMIRAAGARVADADADDLRKLLALREATDEAILAAVAGLRAQQVTWADIGAACGTTRQAAILRWHHKLTAQQRDEPTPAR